MYIRGTKFTVDREFVASEHIISFTITVKKDDVTPNSDGKRLLLAGSVFPKNDETAEGLILDTVDATHEDAPAAVMVEGYVYEGRLPEVIEDAAKEAMKEIKYRK